MAYCPLCEKKFEDRRGLHGHFRFKHGIEYEGGMPAKQSDLTEAIKESIEESKSSKSKSLEKIDWIQMALMYLTDKVEKVHNELKQLRSDRER